MKISELTKPELEKIIENANFTDEEEPSEDVLTFLSVPPH